MKDTTPKEARRSFRPRAERLMAGESRWMFEQSRRIEKTRELGFEPRLTEPKSVVLPLHYSRKPGR